MIVRMVEFTHQAVDVRRCIPTNVGDKQSNELWRDVVKHGAMDTDLLQDVPWKAITRAKDKSEAPVLISISWILGSITQGYLPPQGREAIAKKKKTEEKTSDHDRPCVYNSPIPSHRKAKKVSNLVLQPSRFGPSPLHYTIGRIALPLAHYSPATWPSFSTWLSMYLTQVFCTNIWKTLSFTFTWQALLL